MSAVLWMKNSGNPVTGKTCSTIQPLCPQTSSSAQGTSYNCIQNIVNTTGLWVLLFNSQPLHRHGWHLVTDVLLESACLPRVGGTTQDLLFFHDLRLTSSSLISPLLMWSGQIISPTFSNQEAPPDDDIASNQKEALPSSSILKAELALGTHCGRCGPFTDSDASNPLGTRCGCTVTREDRGEWDRNENRGLQRHGNWAHIYFYFYFISSLSTQVTARCLEPSTASFPKLITVAVCTKDTQ